MRNSTRGTLELTLEFVTATLDVEIDYEVTPGEPMVWYYADGSGYPGSPPECELLGVRVTRTEASGHGAWIWGELERLARASVERDWESYYREKCFEHAADETDNDNSTHWERDL